MRENAGALVCAVEQTQDYWRLDMLLVLRRKADATVSFEVNGAVVPHEEWIAHFANINPPEFRWAVPTNDGSEYWMAWGTEKGSQP